MKHKYPRLMTKFKRELTKQEIAEFIQKCVFCKKPWQGTCGSPQIRWGGCCVGVQTPKVIYLRPRVAHVHCFMKYYGVKQ